MLLAYVDESYTKERYYLVAVAVPSDRARSLAHALDDLVVDTCFAHGGIGPRAELHGYDIVSASREWQGLGPKIRVRIGVYQRALRIIADHGVRIICRGVDIPGLDKRHPNGHDHPHSVVLNFLLEDIDRCAEALGHDALVIADEVDGQDGYRRDLWSYQNTATWGYRGRKLTRVLDTIHFAPSTSSRLLQTADLVAFMHRRRETHTETDPRSEKAWAEMWQTITPNLFNVKCWYPMPKFRYST